MDTEAYCSFLHVCNYPSLMARLLGMAEKEGFSLNFDIHFALFSDSITWHFPGYAKRNEKLKLLKCLEANKRTK